jgi:hypothetical protein
MSTSLATQVDGIQLADTITKPDTMTKVYQKRTCQMTMLSHMDYVVKTGIGERSSYIEADSALPRHKIKVYDNRFYAVTVSIYL